MDVNKRRSRSWRFPSEVEPGTGVEQQLQLMNDLVAGTTSGPEFARAWLAARMRALDNGERVREKFERILYDVFYLLDEEYAIDPALRGPGDLNDAQLIGKVGDAINRLNELED